MLFVVVLTVDGDASTILSTLYSLLSTVYYSLLLLTSSLLFCCLGAGVVCAVNQ